MDSIQLDRGEEWRPTIFAQLDEQDIKPDEPACNCDQALAAEQDRDSLQYVVKGQAAEIRELRLALIKMAAELASCRAGEAT